MTPSQHKTLAFLRRYIDEHGYPPTTREIAEEIGGGSSAAHRCLKGLEERGFIRRLPRRKRAIEIVENPSLPRTQTALAGYPLLPLVAELNRRGLMVGERITEHDRTTGKTHYRVREIRMEELNAQGL